MQPITYYPLDLTPAKTGSQVIHTGDIAGATPIHHAVMAGDTLTLPGNSGVYHILVLFTGSARFLTGDFAEIFSERISFVPAPDQDLAITALTDTHLLEISWVIGAGDAAELAEYQTRFPVIDRYKDAKQYRDRNKSDKTISRVMIEQRNIPRFAMGSVETYGPDFVKAHDHPMLDQYFFSFPENDAFITIDGEPYRMRGGELLYIPLGSAHGVDVVQKKHCHYLWIDFMVDDTAMNRLDTSHIATGTMRSFTDK